MVNETNERTVNGETARIIKTLENGWVLVELDNLVVPVFFEGNEALAVDWQKAEEK